MATVNKNFKIKQGLVVEGTTATVNNFDILTKKQADQDYIVNLIGGTATSANEANKVVKRDANGDFAAGVITADLVGDVTGTVSSLSNHDTADLAENATNKYFTNQRAIDANTGLWDTIGAAATAEANANDYADGLASNYDPAGSASAAQTAAQSYADGLASNYDPAGSAATAQLNAENYADGLAGNYDSYGSASAVQGNLDTHTNATSAHGVTGNIVGTTDAQTISNKTLGSDLAAGGYKVSGLADPTANQDSATKAYVDGAISDLVDSAPALLDTLNELAAAIADNPNYATDIAASLGEKVAKAGDSMTGDLDFGGTHKVTSLATPTNSADAATKGYVDGEISTLDTAAQGYASTAQSNAESFATTAANNAQSAAESFATTAANNAQTAAETFASGLSVNYDAAGAASAAQTAAEGYASGLDSATNTRIDNLDTDDVAEGTRLYFTDARAKTSAADLLTGATLSNITITGTGAGLTITAENGVAGSTTDDLAEGTTNKYFTAQRAVDALEAVVPNFTAVELNSVAKQVAATLSAPTAGVQVAHAFSKADYRSAEYLVKVAYGTHTEISKVLLTLDSSDNIAITEYGIVGTNGSASSVSAGISGSNVQLQVTTANNDSTVTVVGTLLA